MKIALFFIFIICSFNSLALGYTKSIHQDEIQQKLDQMMPFERKKYFVKAKVSDPKIQFREGQDALYVEAVVHASAPGGLSGTGAIGITGNIEYKASEGAFYLQNPKVAKLVFNDVPTAIQPKIKDLVEKAVAKGLKKYPIYTLDDTDTTQKLAKSTIKNIKIVDQHVEIELGLF